MPEFHFSPLPDSGGEAGAEFHLFKKEIAMTQHSELIKNKYEIFSTVLEDARNELRALQFTMNVSRKWLGNHVACLRLDEREAELCWWCIKLESLCILYAKQAA